MAAAVVRWAPTEAEAGRLPTAVAVVRWAPTVAGAGPLPMAVAVVATRAALVVEATFLLRVEEGATIAVAEEEDTDTADSNEFFDCRQR